jgi:hypothetical protein
VICSAGTTCQSAACNCAAGLAACYGECVDLQTDNNNCGECGNQCPNGAPDTGSSIVVNCQGGGCGGPGCGCIIAGEVGGKCKNVCSGDVVNEIDLCGIIQYSNSCPNCTPLGGGSFQCSP